MKAVHFALAATVLGLVILIGVPCVTQAAPGLAPEYAVIQWDGDKKTQVIWPDGHVEFLATLLPGVSVPSGAHQRGYIMTLLINKIAKDGYEYVGMASGEEIVMKKRP
jgi:hypothetical protein